jgi:hypothetical protein
MVHAMQTPKHWNVVKDPVLDVNGQVQQEERDDAPGPQR